MFGNKIEKEKACRELLLHSYILPTLSLKELQNRTLHIILVWTLFCLNGFM